MPIKSYLGTRHDDRTRHYLCGKGNPLLEARYDGIVYTESFTEKKGGLSSNRLTREQLGAEIGPGICDLEPHVNREEPKTFTAKAGLAGEIKRAHSEFDTTEILPEEKQRGPQIGGVNSSLPPLYRSNSPIEAMKLRSLDHK